MYRLRTLGGAAVLRDGSLLDSFTGQRKLIALLALLGAAGRRGVSRERLAALLWPESDMERARGSLKQSLHMLRRQFGTTEIVAGSVELRLNEEQIESDVEQFMAAVQAGDSMRAVDLYGGPFLDGFHLTGAPEFEQWMEEHRALLARRHAESLEAVAHASQQRGAFTEAAALWRRLQASDPFSARAVTGLMETLVAVGERGTALRAGDAYVTLMREELGVGADAAVTSLLQRLRAMPPDPAAREVATSGPPAAVVAANAPTPPGNVAIAPPARDAVTLGGQDANSHTTPASRDAAPAPARSRTVQLAAFLMLAAAGLFTVWQLAQRGADAEPARTSIAVIPFANTSDNAADGYFADGLTDELISTLGRVEGLRVAARTSTFALKDRGLSARAFADTLGVAAVIEGTVRRQDGRLKITAQLVDPEDNRVLWSASFDRQVQDMIAVQEEIALAIVQVLQGQPPARSPAQPVAATRPAVDSEAYDLYLRGRYNWDLPTPDRLEQGVRYQQRAVERDPTFAAAHAALAEAYVNMAIYGYLAPDEALARANIAAERALELDANLVEALIARAYARLSQLDFAGAETDLRQALSVNPNYSWAHHFSSLHMMMVGRPEDAERHNRQALLLDPLSLPANATRGAVQAQRGNLPAAERELQRALRLRSDFTLTLYYLGAVQAARGSHQDAATALQHAARQAPDYPGLAGALAFTLRHTGHHAEADSIMSALERRAATDPRARLNLGLAHGALGRNDAAMAQLDDVRWDVPSLIGLRSDPLLAGLRSDPRCIRLLQSLAAQRSGPM
jgi:TolB-like protein/DNA-binding SARP family transcriptional activator/Tfp pilus assembly protein PilF